MITPEMFSLTGLDFLCFLWFSLQLQANVKRVQRTSVCNECQLQVVLILAGGCPKAQCGVVWPIGLLSLRVTRDEIKVIKYYICCHLPGIIYFSLFYPFVLRVI